MTMVHHHRGTAIRRWAVAVTVYLVAVFHRTSLGVAGLQASDRFGISPSQLSVFVMLQLGVYAAMQIPTGILVDRYGPRRLLLAAAGTMFAAQLLFAIADNYPAAVVARALLGCGDALTFVSVLRFAATQFAPSRYPLVVAATTTVGTAGNIVATVPLSAALHSVGWTPTFAVAAALSAVSGVGVYFVLPRSQPSARQRLELASFRASLDSVGRRVAMAWSKPGTRAGFWVHFTSMSTAIVFGLLWGVPFLVEGQGMSRGAASSVLLASVLIGLVAGPIVGVLIGRYPATRVPVAIGLNVLIVLGWYAVLGAYSTPAPRSVLITLVLVTSLGGPVSAIGFALARDYNGPAIVGTATGVVNVGGFLAGMLGALVIGWALDAAGAPEGPDLHAYRIAFGLAVIIQAAGLVQMIRWWLRARRAVLTAQDIGAPTPMTLVRHRWDLS
ncbi:MAG: transporter [Frankiales bacterium]|nr:transporter [Frankiales bacterium]